MIGHLNIAMPADAADPFRSETKTLTTKQYFVRGLTPLFKDHIAALLPGLHALTCSNLWASHAEAAEAQSLFCEVMKLRAVEASLKVHACFGRFGQLNSWTSSAEALASQPLLCDVTRLENVRLI